jgi:hypothetical protein
MILFELKCTNRHHFEAWFRDGGAFDRQAKGGKVECPVCLDTSVVKAPMAPAVSTYSRKNSNKQQGEHRAKEVAREIIKAVSKIQKHVEENCDYVGDKFAEEAKAIHYGEAEERGIYGEATDQEAVELFEEDSPVCKVPWNQRRDS